ncbi:hypothetical protein [Streptomyces sp. AC1-42T]|uniref:hypothetical protein n=1 Tax=Streptomyces sp. AC1-42T TaxID=2218665 RepID=UPI000DAEACE4|nr:hypothetical protein [Streptomyces sp. AC1-42T]PZT71439.1 hypothetical protein DNK55_32515 [Streptomyces sp. AC1-42T]
MRSPVRFTAIVCVAAAAAWWWPHRSLRQHLTESEMARIDQQAVHQQTTAHLRTALEETTARLHAALILTDATDVINRAQAREEY